jgi:hypothetical protein
VEGRVGVAEGGLAEAAEAVEEPGLEVVFAGVDVDGEVDVVGDEDGRGGAARTLPGIKFDRRDNFFIRF